MQTHLICTRLHSCEVVDVLSCGSVVVIYGITSADYICISDGCIRSNNNNDRSWAMHVYTRVHMLMSFLNSVHHHINILAGSRRGPRFMCRV